MANKCRFMIMLLILLNSGCAGPWKGKIIDLRTKEPLEGAVVLAVWERVYRTPYGGNSYFYEAKEVLTDKAGEFEIPSYTPVNLLPIISYIQGPEFTIFKSGYGGLRMGLGEFLSGKTTEVEEMELSGKKYRLAPGVIELPKLKTREERLNNLTHPFIPENKMAILMKLLEQDKIELGITRIHSK